MAGLVLGRLGRLPEPGETVQADGWRLEILAVDRRAITRLRLVPLDRQQPADSHAAGA